MIDAPNNRVIASHNGRQGVSGGGDIGGLIYSSFGPAIEKRPSPARVVTAKARQFGQANVARGEASCAGANANGTVRSP
jgi:hypothetical protein